MMYFPNTCAPKSVPCRIWIASGLTVLGSIGLLNRNSSVRFSGTLSCPDWRKSTRTRPFSVSPVDAPPVPPPQAVEPRARPTAARPSAARAESLNHTVARVTSMTVVAPLRHERNGPALAGHQARLGKPHAKCTNPDPNRPNPSRERRSRRPESDRPVSPPPGRAPIVRFRADVRTRALRPPGRQTNGPGRQGRPGPSTRAGAREHRRYWLYWKYRSQLSMYGPGSNGPIPLRR